AGGGGGEGEGAAGGARGRRREVREDGGVSGVLGGEPGELRAVLELWGGVAGDAEAAAAGGVLRRESHGSVSPADGRGDSVPGTGQEGEGGAVRRRRRISRVKGPC